MEAKEKKRTEWLQIRATKEEKKAIKKRAEEDGLTISSYARMVLLKDARKEK